MNNIEFMKVFNTSNDLMEKSTCFRFLDPLVLYNEVKQLTATCILHYQIQLLWGFDYLYFKVKIGSW